MTAVAVDEHSKYIAVGNCLGEVKVLTFQSGGVLYTLPHQEKEITCLKFLTGSKLKWCDCFSERVLACCGVLEWEIDIVD